jgi:NADH dehydrogenase [ubiquinone] 1 alpha subcomplex assembly factor 7
MLVVANEFLDALPIRQVVRTESGWAERLVALDHDSQLVFASGPPSAAAAVLVPARLRRSPEGALVEFCPAAVALAAFLGRRFTREPGAALLVDYGYCGEARGSTLRALRRHRPASVLSRPGTADLSADVDFAAVAAAARAAGAEVHGPVGQGRFLAALGAAARCERLCAHASPGRRDAIRRDLARLVDPAAMGERWKAMAVTGPGLAVPAGFGGAEPER